MVTALGEKLFLSLFVLAYMDLKRLPDGQQVEERVAGVGGSFRRPLALLRQREP